MATGTATERRARTELRPGVAFASAAICVKFDMPGLATCISVLMLTRSLVQLAVLVK